MICDLWLSALRAVSYQKEGRGGDQRQEYERGENKDQNDSSKAEGDG